MKRSVPSPTAHLAAGFRAFGHIRRFGPGQLLFHKDDPAEEIYYLASGKVRAFLLYPDGAEQTICYVEQGYLVGEELMGEPARRIVSADSAGRCVLYALNFRELTALFQQDPAALRELLAIYMGKIELLSNWIYYSRFPRAEARVACFLCDHCHAGEAVSYTQEQIASVTDMSRVSVSKALKRFEEDGLIEKRYGGVAVKDREALKSIFEGREF